MKDYHISGIEFPTDGETAKQHSLVVDMDKSSIYTLTKDSSSHVKKQNTTMAKVWREHRMLIIIVLVLILILIIVVLLALIASRVVGP